MPLRPHSITIALASMLLAACASSAGGAPVVLPIGQVQGPGDSSPVQGQAVRVEGVVTADFRDGLGGFFVQDRGDGNAATSDALFVVAAADAQPAIRVGDRVRIEGVVTELAAGNHPGTLTAIAATTWVALGRGDLPITVLRQPPAQWEALEGRRVRVVAPLTISGSHDLARFGELIASFDGRLWQPSEIAAPGSTRIQQVLADNARRRLILDDGSSARDRGALNIWVPARSRGPAAPWRAWKGWSTSATATIACT